MGVSISTRHPFFVYPLDKQDFCCRIRIGEKNEPDESRGFKKITSRSLSRG